MNNRIRAIGLAIALAFILMPGAFLYLHLTTPFDGARLEPGESTWRANGAVVTPLEERADGLHKGDIVIAVTGRSLEDWADHSLDMTLARPALHVGDKVTYTVIRGGQTIDVEVPLEPYRLEDVVAQNWSTFFGTLFCQLIFTLVFLFRPDDRAARMLFFWGWSFTWLYTWSIGLQISDLVSPLALWVYRIGATAGWLLFWSADLAFILIFPKVHPAVQRRPRILWAVFGAPVILYAVFITFSLYHSASHLLWQESWTVGDWLMAIAYQLVALIILILGYRSYYDAEARRRMRLLAFGFALGNGLILVLWIIPGILGVPPLISASALGLTIVPFPTALAIAVSRRQAFDIDIIIRRTLVYTVLTALLAILYAGGVIVLQQFFRALTGQGSDLAIVVSTLAIAALFVPLRGRLQSAIDRRFFRQKYDARKVLSAFGTTMRDETDLDRLEDELVAVVESSMQPDQVGLWLRESAPAQQGRPLHERRTKRTTRL